MVKIIKRAGDFADDALVAKEAAKKEQQKAGKKGAKATASRARVKKVKDVIATKEEDSSAGKYSGRAPKTSVDPLGRRGGVKGRGGEGPLKTAAAHIGVLLEEAADLVADSFVDDDVGAKLSTKEEAKKRASKDKHAAGLKESEREARGKLAESGGASSEAPPEEVGGSVGLGREGEVGGTDGVEEKLHRWFSASGEGQLNHLDVIAALEARAVKLQERVLELEGQAVEAGDGALKGEPLLECAAKIREAHSEFKVLLRELFFPEKGQLRPLADKVDFRQSAYNQFAGLFYEVGGKWPATIPPGKACERGGPGEFTWSKEDWDDFIGWVMCPPPIPEEVLKGSFGG